MPSSPDQVVLVHGLWMPAASMALLGKRLRRAGFCARSFGYPSVADDLSTNAWRLAAFAFADDRKGRDGDAPVRLHLVGHSTGGALLLRALADSPALAERVSRVVLLGIPYADSAAAHSLLRLPGGHRMLGRTLREWLATPRPRPDPRHQVGVIAGSRPLGLSRMLIRLPGINDGAVSLEEARVPGACDTILMPVAHSSLILSAGVADEVVAFLRTGRFSPGAPRV
jgi:pimeloyl-ACP methyl ester carboxylesterase